MTLISIEVRRYSRVYIACKSALPATRVELLAGLVCIYGKLHTQPMGEIKSRKNARYAFNSEKPAGHFPIDVTSFDICARVFAREKSASFLTLSATPHTSFSFNPSTEHFSFHLVCLPIASVFFYSRLAHLLKTCSGGKVDARGRDHSRGFVYHIEFSKARGRLARTRCYREW